MAPEQLTHAPSKLSSGVSFVASTTLASSQLNQYPACAVTFSKRAPTLSDCPIYDAHRHHLRAVSRTLSLCTILSTKYGLEALAKFVTDPLPNHVHRCFARTCKGPILSGWNDTNTPGFVPVDMSMEVGMKSQYPEKWGLHSGQEVIAHMLQGCIAQ